MDSLIIASAYRDQMHLWLDMLSSKYSVAFSDNIEMIISQEKQDDNDILLVLDARLINEKNHLSLICQHVNKVIVIGEEFTPTQQIEFIYEGAWGYSDRLIDNFLILRIVESVTNNEIWLKRQFVPQMLKGILEKQKILVSKEKLDHEMYKDISVLTQREIEVLEKVYNGDNNVFIAEQLHISVRTVKAHLTSIFRKLNVQDRFHLVVFLKDLQVGHLTS